MDWRCRTCISTLALPKRVLQSLYFTVNRVLMKLFKSSNTVVIEQCRYFFHIELPSVLSCMHVLVWVCFMFSAASA